MGIEPTTLCLGSRDTVVGAESLELDRVTEEIANRDS